MNRSTRLGLFALSTALWIAMEPTPTEAQWIARRVLENAQQRINSAPLLPGRDPAARLNPNAANAPEATAPRRPIFSNRANYNSPASRRAGEANASPAQPGLRAPVNSSPLTSPTTRPTTASATTSRPTAASSRSLLGVSVEAPPSVIVPGQAPRRPRGASVVATTPGSGAEAAGLSAGDMIVSINGRVVPDVDQFFRQLSVLSPGQPVEIKYVRNGNLRVANTVMADRNGRLNPAEYAEVQAMANTTTSRSQQNVPASGVQPASGEEQVAAPDSSAFGGIGNAVGSWLGSRSATPRSQPSSVVPAGIADPAVSGLESPAPNSEAMPPSILTKPGQTAALPTPAPKVKEASVIENQSDGELLPPVAKPNFSKTSEKADTSDEDEQAAVKALLKEVERLQERVKQLESAPK